MHIFYYSMHEIPLSDRRTKIDHSLVPAQLGNAFSLIIRCIYHTSIIGAYKTVGSQAYIGEMVTGAGR